MERWARQLGLKPGTEEWQEFMDQAAVARGELPKAVLSDDELLRKLPVFFRSIRGAELTEEQLDDLIQKVREAHSPGERKRKV